MSDHLQQLALFVAAPAGQLHSKEDGSEFPDDSDSEEGLQSEIQSILSKNTHRSKREIHVADVKDFIADQKRASGIAEATSIPGIMKVKDRSTRDAKDTHSRPGQMRDAETVIPSFPIFTQMPPPNEHFYSMESLLTRIGKGLYSSGLICILHGVGGVGKAIAATQYSYIHRKHCDAIFWLQADTASSISDSYLQMVMALGIASRSDDHHHIIAKGRDWLQDTGMSNLPAPFASVF